MKKVAFPIPPSHNGQMTYPHWYYFVALVDDLERSSRFVEICQDNFKCYSIEYSRILFAACSEIDVVAKLLCARSPKKGDAKNIDQYRTIIAGIYPSLPQVEIAMPRFELEFKPWASWSQNVNPAWWTSYNKVKHQRDKHFQEATLEATLNAVGALCIVVCHLYHVELASHKLNPTPSFLFLGTQYAFGSAFVGVPSYYLPDCGKPQGEWVLKGKKQFFVPPTKK